MRTVRVIDAIIVLLSRMRAQVISPALPTVKEKSRAQGDVVGLRSLRAAQSL